MKYEKPIAEIIDFRITDHIMDVGKFSEGVGNEGEGGEYGDG